MRYLYVKWHHRFPDEPIELYSELDDARNELRKVEIYEDGRIGYASVAVSTQGSALSLEALPELSVIALDTQFEPKEIGKGEFEEVWQRAIAAGNR